ncbi:MAG: T9SS type A sorting domain-containing protein [Bacteroidetes bacterium]|nr:T9SS type A sorting domain-containing protein [Bacteroidota bacterium]
MNKNFIQSFLILCLLLSVLFTKEAYAQPPYYNFVPAGGANGFPLNAAAATGKKVQWMMLPGDFALPTPAPAGNNITSIWVYKAASAANTVTYTTLTVKFATVPINTYFTIGAWYPGAMTTALSQTTALTVGATAGWVEIPLTIPYLYDPSQNLVVEISHCGYSGTGFSLPQNALGGAPNYRRQYSDASSLCGVTPLATGGDFGVAGIGLSLSPASPCTSPPTAGTSTASPGVVCIGANVTLNLTGNTVGTGQTYQWEASTLIGGPYSPISIPLASPSFTTPANAPLYYQCAVTCSGNTQYSTPVLVTPTNGLSGNFTINSALPTGGNNFQTFTAAVNALNCGVAGPVVFDVAVGSGPYNEQISIPQVAGASAINTITFNGNGETLTYAATLSTAPHTLVLNGADYITVNNLNITGTGATYALSCHLWNNADYNNFNNCTFTCPANGTATTNVPFSISGTATTGTGTGVACGSNNIITNCNTVSGYYNLCVVGSSTLPNTGNQVINCHAQDFYFYGIYCTYQNGVVVRGNLVDRPNRTTLSTFYGIYIMTQSTNALVENNRIRNPFAQLLTSGSTAYGIYSTSDGALGTENKYYNNIISDMKSDGIIYGFYLSGADFVKVYHNTVSLDYAGSLSGTTYGIFNTGTLGGIDVRNNIVSITRGGSGTKYCLYYSNAGTISNKNVLYLNSPAGLNYHGYYLGAQATFANWQAVNANAFDQQSVAANPLYFSPATNDYTPTELLFNNIGDPVGVALDITGYTRSVSTPDPGAYEYANASVDLGLTALNQPDNTGCYSATQNVTVTIINSGIVPMDFSITPATLTCNITGALVTTLNAVVNSGTLAPNASLNYTFPTTIDMTANGAYTFNANVVVAGDGNAGNNNLNPVTRTVGVIAGTLTVSSPSGCVSGTPVLTLTGSYGGAIQWQESTVSPAGPWTNVGAGLTTYAPGTVTQTTYYQAVLTCNANTVTSNGVTYTINNPIITSTTPDTVCSGNSATLEATASVGSVKWYNVPTGGSPLFTGPIYTTAPLNITTTFYAEASTGTPPTTHLTTMAAGNGSSANAFPIAATNSITITQFSGHLSSAIGTPSNWEVWYRPDNYQLIPNSQTTTAGWTLLGTATGVPSAGPGVPTLIPVTFNVNIPAGQTYSFQVGVTTGSLAYTNGTLLGAVYNSNPDFSVIQGHGGTLFAGQTISPRVFNGLIHYYSGCAGPREPVVATVDPTPAITATPSVATFCQASNITLTGGGAGVGGTYVWTGGVTDGVPFPATVSTIYTVTGTTALGCSNTATSDITVNPIVTGTASVSPSPICLGASATFSGNIPTICAGSVSDFAGEYAPGNWVISQTNSNGTVNTAGAPTTIVLTSGTNASNFEGSTNFTKTIGCSGTVSFNWSYTHPDALLGSIYDFPRLKKNGVFVQGPPNNGEFPGFVIGLPSPQNGTVTLPVNAGDVIELQAYTIDNDPTPCTVTITNFSAPAPPIGGSVSFWDAPIGGTNLGAPPIPVTPAVAGPLTYYAEYTALGSGCVNPVRDAVTLTVNALPAVVANASPSATICNGEQLTLSGSGANTYVWNGPIAVTDGTAFTASPAAVGLYTVTGTDGAGCTNTSSINIAVTVVPDPTVVGDDICSPGGVVNLSASGTGTLNWYNVITGGSIINTGTNYNPSVATTTTYYVENSTTITTPPVQIPLPNQAATFTGNVRGYYFVAPTNFTMTSVYVPLDAGGGTQNIAVVKFNGNTPPPIFGLTTNAFTTEFLTQNNATVGNIAVNIPVLAGEVIGILGCRGTANSYAPGPNTTTIAGFTTTISRLGMQFQLPTVAPQDLWTEAGGSISRVFFEYTTTTPGCTSSPRIPVTATVNPLPTVTASPASQTICENAQATVNGGGAVSYVWTGGISNGVPFTVTGSNVYTVTGTDGNGCENTATAEVLMNAAPVVNATATPSTTCNLTSVNPCATGAVTYVWTGGLSNCTPFVATTTDTYTVTGTDGAGCTGTSSVTVTVNPASGTLAPITSNQSQDHGDDFNINYYAANCDLIATVDDGAGGNVLGLTTSTVNVDATASFHNGQPFVRRWYQITPTTNGSADVKLYINQTDFDDYNAAVVAPYLPLPTGPGDASGIANIRITKNDDGGLGNNPIVITPAVSWNGTYWELSFNTPSFSQFRVHSVNPGNVPLPVTVTSFSGTKLESSDKLSWITSSEQNNAYFNLQHSTDGISFSTIAKVASKAPNGNSNTALSYTATNNKPALGHNYYRLQQVDIDNKVSVHAQIVDLIWGANGSTVSIYPNPTTDILNIDLYATAAQNTTVKLLDMSGRVIRQVQAKSSVGMNNIQLSLGEIASGVYTVQVYENNHLTHTSKVKKND